MIVTLIGVGLLVVGIILAITKVHFKSWKVRDRIEWVTFPSILVGFGITLCSIIFILFNVCVYDVEYQNMLHTRDTLEYRIEHMEDNITGNEMLYNDIVDFNNELRAVKKWANSPWTNWFNNRYVASLDYIELDND